MIRRRKFIGSLMGGATLMSLSTLSRWLEVMAVPSNTGFPISDIRDGEDLFAYIARVHGSFDLDLYKRILGAANEYKEGDEIIGVAAVNQSSRENARQLLANTRLRDLDAHPVHDDQLHRLLTRTLQPEATARTAALTLGELRSLLLTESEQTIKAIAPGLSSDVIGCVVKLMNNEELISVGAKVFNPLPGSQVGAKGYLGARIQPNSPTDNVEDIRWQVFDGWSYAVGDALLGTNPVSSEAASVDAVQRTLQDLLVTFELDKVMPHCVLSHIDVQAEVERARPGSTALWFQSIAGSDAANTTFDIDIEKMLSYAAARTGPFGMYFETGQGADFTNGHGHGFDMVVHESRKYGFARAMTRTMEETLAQQNRDHRPWVHLNDVAGFIGPEVFRTREQLVRCCLEDTVMGKLHGLCIGLDVCSTLHMDISLDDLDWCLDQIMPANPAYLMALPTKIDPMLGYLTTGFQDHVRLRGKFGYKVADRMWQFFQQLQVIGQNGQPTENFGNPLWVFLKYCRKKGDVRTDEQILYEGRQQLARVRGRGVFIAQGRGENPWDLEPKLEHDIRTIYADAKKSIWTELEPAFVGTIPNAVTLSTQSVDRTDYILHPESGERLTRLSDEVLHTLRQQHNGKYDVQIVVSDGLNALAIMDPAHLTPFLSRLREGLVKEGYRPAPEHIVVRSGRVRAGYRIGETLFAGLKGNRVILHVIGERPGTGHHTFSIYITGPHASTWGAPGQVDHNITKVVSGVARTALAPTMGAEHTIRVLNSLV